MADKFVKFAQDLIESKDTNLGAGLRQTGDNVKEAQIAAKSRQKAQKAKNTQSLIQGTTSIIGALAKIELEQRQLDVTLDGDRKHNEYFQGLKNLTPAEKVSSIKNLMENNTVYEGFKEDLKKANIPDYVARGLLKAYGTRQRTAVTRELAKAIPQVNAEKKKVLKQVTSNIAVDVEANPNQDPFTTKAVVDGAAKLFALTGDGTAALNTVKSTALDAQIRGLINQGSLEKASTLLTDIENRKRIGIKQARKLDGLLGKAEKEGRNQIGVQVDLFKEALKNPKNFTTQLASLATSHEATPEILDSVNSILVARDKMVKGTFSDKDIQPIMKKIESSFQGKLDKKKLFSLQNSVGRSLDNMKKLAKKDYPAFMQQFTGERPTGVITLTGPEIKEGSDLLVCIGSGKCNADDWKNRVNGIADKDVLRQTYYLQQGEGSQKEQYQRTLARTLILNSDNVHVNEIKDYMDNPDTAKNGVRGLNQISVYETKDAKVQFLGMSEGEFKAAAQSFGNDSNMFMTVVGVKTAINVQKDLPVKEGEDVKLYALRYRAAFNLEAPLVAQRLHQERVDRGTTPKDPLLAPYINDAVSGLKYLVDQLPFPEEQREMLANKVTGIDSSWLPSVIQGQIGSKQVMLDKNGSEINYFVNDENADGTTTKRYIVDSGGEKMTVSLSMLTHLAAQQLVAGATALNMSAGIDNPYSLAKPVLTQSKTQVENYYKHIDLTDADAITRVHHASNVIRTLKEGFGTARTNFKSKEEQQDFAGALSIGFAGAESGISGATQIPTRGDKATGVGDFQINMQGMLKHLSPDQKLKIMKAAENNPAFITTLAAGIANDNAKVAHNRMISALKDVAAKGDVGDLKNVDALVLRAFLYNGGSHFFSGPEFVKDWAKARRDPNHVIQVRKTKYKSGYKYQPMRSTAEQLGHAIKVLNYSSSDDILNADRTPKRPMVNHILSAKYNVYNPDTGKQEVLTGKQLIIKTRGKNYLSNLFSPKTHDKAKQLLGDNAEKINDVKRRGYWQKQ